MTGKLGRWGEVLADPWGTHRGGRQTEPVPAAPGPTSAFNDPERAVTVMETQVINPRLNDSLLNRAKPRVMNRLRWLNDESRRSTAVAGANGQAEIRFGPVPQRERWRIDRGAVQTVVPSTGLPDTLGSGSILLYAGSAQPGSIAPGDLIDGTNQPNFGTFGGADGPITLAAGETLRIVWVGLPANEQVSARIHLDRYILETVPLAAVGGSAEPIE